MVQRIAGRRRHETHAVAGEVADQLGGLGPDGSRSNTHDVGGLPDGERAAVVDAERVGEGAR